MRHSLYTPKSRTVVDGVTVIADTNRTLRNLMLPYIERAAKNLGLGRVELKSITAHPQRDAINARRYSLLEVKSE